MKLPISYILKYIFSIIKINFLYFPDLKHILVSQMMLKAKL